MNYTMANATQIAERLQNGWMPMYVKLKKQLETTDGFKFGVGEVLPIERIGGEWYAIIGDGRLLIYEDEFAVLVWRLA